MEIFLLKDLFPLNQQDRTFVPKNTKMNVLFMHNFISSLYKKPKIAI